MPPTASMRGSRRWRISGSIDAHSHAHQEASFLAPTAGSRMWSPGTAVPFCGLRACPISRPCDDCRGASLRVSDPQGPPASPLELNLSSSRVRLAMHLLDGMRQGQPLGALLGYRLERTMHDSGLQTWITDVARDRSIQCNDRQQHYHKRIGRSQQRRGRSGHPAHDLRQQHACHRLWIAHRLRHTQQADRRTPDTDRCSRLRSRI